LTPIVKLFLSILVQVATFISKRVNTTGNEMKWWNSDWHKKYFTTNTKHHKQRDEMMKPWLAQKILHNQHKTEVGYRLLWK